MKMSELLGIAKKYGIRADVLSKRDLIRNIQITEGNFDCYASAYDGFCDQKDCSWRQDCFESSHQKDPANDTPKHASKACD